MTITGRTYLERAIGPDWRRLPPSPVVVLAEPIWKPGSPRNVLVQREDGTCAVRPFRGLRKAPGNA